VPSSSAAPTPTTAPTPSSGPATPAGPGPSGPPTTPATPTPPTTPAAPTPPAGPGPVPPQESIGRLLEITVTDQNGEEITEFDEDLTFTTQLDVKRVDLLTVEVFFFDVVLGQWVQIPSFVTADGTVSWTVRHLTIFSVIALPKVSIELHGGMNMFAFVGADGTSIAAFAGSLIGDVEEFLVFDPGREDPDRQLFRSPWAGGQGFAEPLTTLSSGDVVFVRVAEGGSARLTSTDVVAGGLGGESAELVSGLNAIGYTGADGTAIGDLLAPLMRTGVPVRAAWRFNAEMQTWEGHIPGAPAAVNTLYTVNRLDALFIRVDPDAPPRRAASPSLTPLARGTAYWLQGSLALMWLSHRRRSLGRPLAAARPGREG
jgi:hypothetical protein